MFMFKRWLLLKVNRHIFLTIALRVQEQGVVDSVGYFIENVRLPFAKPRGYSCLFKELCARLSLSLMNFSGILI